MSAIFTPVISFNMQQSVAAQMLSAFLDSDDHIFILTGCAGSGKTTLMAEVIEALKSSQRLGGLMAATGMAANVVSEKTNSAAKTVHSFIYTYKDGKQELDMIDTEKDMEGIVITEEFELKKNDYAKDSVFIIDEAGMLSEAEMKDKMVKFGSGSLLKDLLHFFDLQNGETTHKLILLGDNYQLPPVCGPEVALQTAYYQRLGYKVRSCHLSEPMRQHVMTDLGKLCQNALRSVKLSQPIIMRNCQDAIGCSGAELINRYADELKNGQRSTILMAFKNETVYSYNLQIRNKLYANPGKLELNEKIVICKNVLIEGIQFYNGESGTVVGISNNEETVTQWITTGKGKKTEIKLRYRTVKLKIEHCNNLMETECKVLMNSLEPDFNKDQTAYYVRLAQIINLRQRLDKMVNEKGGRLSASEKLMHKKSDLYINALHIKYGYAITCHKAQGGEWDHVYIDFTGRTYTYQDNLRWCYTAITRARNKIFFTGI